MVGGLCRNNVAIIIMCVASLTCQQLLSKTDFDVIGYESSEANVVRSKRKAEEILKRYGYLKCDSVTRKGEDLLVQMTIDLIGLNVFAPPQPTCSEKQIRNAIKHFQLTYNMHPSGKLDAKTLKVMSKTRCGNPDDGQDDGLDALYVSTGNKKELSRNRRSKTVSGKQENSPVTYIEDVLLSKAIKRRRHQLFKEYSKKLRKTERRSNRHAKRPKRSTRKDLNSSKDVVKWRLVRSGYSSQMASLSQRAALCLAFRIWSEVIPLMFVEDNVSPVDDIHIQIAFGRGKHMSCPNNFDGFGGQLGHAIRFRGSGRSQIHVDDDEHYTVGVNSGTNLVKVAVHEIGHALGLLHTSLSHSIMYAIYSKHISSNSFELSAEDRSKVQKIYGICDGSFDMVIDWIKKSPKEGIIFNTYFFKKNRYWLYQNKYNRTRYGDPFMISEKWNGLPNNLDCFAHVWTKTRNKVFFFKGQYYWLYDTKANRIKRGYPRRIQMDFRAPRGVKRTPMPRKVDAAYFNPTDKYLYFFRHDLVYAYDATKGRRGNVVPGFPKTIRAMFQVGDNSLPLPSKLDTVYYSYSDSTIFFFKGTNYWRLIGASSIQKNGKNEVAGPWKINTKWKDICDVNMASL